MTNTMKRGEIYYADLSPVVGSEQGGIRPVLILQNDTGNKFSSTTIVAPIVLLEQLRTIDKKRLSDRLRQISVKDMHQIESAMNISLGMKPEARHE